MFSEEGTMMRFAALLLFGLVVTSGLAADYPARPIRLIVPYPPGGTLDVLARGIGPELTTQLGQPIVIENRSGAAGAIGTEAAAKASPDGYTLLIGGGSGTAVHALLRNVPYDPVKAFSPIGTLATYPSVLIVNPGTPAKSVQELIALAKASPGKMSYGSPGTGNINNLVGELFKSLAGVDIVHVPYKGAALVITDVVAGHVPVGFVLLPGAMGQLRSGKLRALAVTTEERVSAVPDVPTMRQAGVRDLVLFDWSGLFAPAGTPKDVIARLSAEVRKVVLSPQMRQRSVEQGFEPKALSGEEMAALMKSDAEKWARIVKQTGTRLE
jgi:tripartite-type tricarboxylate transporter receptor subunit TctC